MGFIRDVAEHKRALDAMRNMAEELERLGWEIERVFGLTVAGLDAAGACKPVVLMATDL